MSEAENENFYMVKFATNKYGSPTLLLTDTKKVAKLSAPGSQRVMPVKISREFAEWIRSKGIALMYIERLPDYGSRIIQIGNAFNLDRANNHYWTPKKFEEEALKLRGLAELMEGRKHEEDD